MELVLCAFQLVVIIIGMLVVFGGKLIVLLVLFKILDDLL